MIHPPRLQRLSPRDRGVHYAHPAVREAAVVGVLDDYFGEEVAAVVAPDATGQLIRVGVGRSDVAPAPGNRRFADRAWHSNPVFRRLMQVYLVEQQVAHRVIDEVELDYKSRDRAHFAVSLLTEALVPTNSLLTNPNALAKAAQTRGQSLVAGARHFAHDLRHNGGMPSQVDTRGIDPRSEKEAR